ncbi:hypothetical protein SOVF_009970 [Spinacia oleracea]|uniref:Uncharacterized protein n=1 Tax=Spinacia oleracea TaxID=3562 RepID=A0A9R0IF24_SPIOL|nr:uncharacterized protein LOC110786666 [Spinacia oleracea]KNA25064.1 hypothetical protein SOVF_009970 [Spinacia oleracea]
MKGETALITVDCLRGRLLAERASSRAAEHNVELLAIKLSELEEQVKIEMKLRRKAEKKLNSLRKKLESLNIPMNKNIEESELSSSNASDDVSCMSSITSTSFNQEEDHLLPGLQGSKSSSINSEIAEEITESEINLVQKRQDQCERQELDDDCHGLKQLALEEKSNNDEIEEDEDKSDVDNSMALVTMSPIVEPVNSSSNGPLPLEVKSENVKQVLDNLKLIRDNLRNSLEQRRFIKVA